MKKLMVALWVYNTFVWSFVAYRQYGRSEMQWGFSAMIAMMWLGMLVMTVAGALPGKATHE